MQAQQNIADFQEKFIIKVDAGIAKIVTDADRRALAAEYLNMFTGFSCVNWANKYSLGRAWQTALAQCGAFVDTKNEKNPAAKYLKNVYASHKQYWSRVIMTHRGRENIINPDDKQIKQFQEHGVRMLRAAMDKINLILARYNERLEELMVAQARAQQQTQALGQVRPQLQPKSPQVVQPQPGVQVQPQLQSGAQAQSLSGVAQQNAAKWANGARAVEQMQPQVAQNAVKSVAAQVGQSGAFAMTRDTVKRLNASVQDKPVELPGLAMRQVQPEKMPVSAVKAPQPKQSVVMENSKELPKPIVQHAVKSVAAPVSKSGALPVVRDTVKQSGVVKTEVQPKLVTESKQTPVIELNPQVVVQKLNFQRQLQIWQLGQFKQNAA